MQGWLQRGIVRWQLDTRIEQVAELLLLGLAYWSRRRWLRAYDLYFQT